MYRICLISIFFSLLASASTCYAQESEQQKVSGHTAYINGMEAFENEEYQDAIRLFSDAYTKLPNSSGITFALADAYLQLGDLSNALYHAKQAVDMEPSNKWYRLKVAEIHRFNGQNDSAIEAYRAILRTHSNDEQTLHQLAQALDANNKLIEANKVYKKLLNGTDKDITIRMQRAQNFLSLEMKDSALTELQQIQQLNPNETEMLQALSDIYLKLGNTDKAESLLQQALEKGSQNPQSHIKLANIFATQSSWEKVQATLQKVLTDSLLDPEDKLPVAQYILSEYNAAPSNSQIIDTATNLLKIFIDNEPNFTRAHSLAAKFFAQTNQPQKALEALATTTELQPLDDEAWKQRLQLLLNQNNFQQVIELAPEAEKNIPQDPFILYFIGTAHLELDNFQAAADKFKKASRYPARRNFKSMIYTALGKAEANQSKYEEAGQTFEQALKVDGDNAEAMEHLGNVYDKTGKPELAKEWWQKALEKDPSRSHLKQKISQ